MSILCFASLKGGVGKTSLSVNVSHAFAERDCRTLLIDLDCAAHASRLLKGKGGKIQFPRESELARLFLSQDFHSQDPSHEIEEWRFNQDRIEEKQLHSEEDLHNEDIHGEKLYSKKTSKEQTSGARFAREGIPPMLVHPVRKRLDLLPATADLKYFLWGRGARAFRILFPKLLAELREEYDHIVIDTPPDLNVITRNSIASADIVCVPVDSSEMSIHCLEDIVSQTSHIKGPIWSIVRTMVNAQASRVRQLVSNRLHENLPIDDSVFGEERNGESGAAGFEDPAAFISFLKSRDEEEDTLPSSRPVSADENPIFLLHSYVRRTEEQNRLSFLQMTAFDTKQTQKLAREYLSVAKELENLPSYTEPKEEEGKSVFPLADIFESSMGNGH